MRVKPVRCRRVAKYPTHIQIQASPNIETLTPLRWRSNWHVMASLSAIGMAASLSLGQERAAVGGAVALPRYLTESEALSIIRVEAKKVGLELVHKGRSIAVPIPMNNGKKPIVKKYCFDESDIKKGVNIDFLTYSDAYELYGDVPPLTPSILAKKISEILKSKRIMIVAESGAQDSNLQAKQLRKDLQDFFAWLKKQGVI